MLARNERADGTVDTTAEKTSPAASADSDHRNRKGDLRIC